MTNRAGKSVAMTLVWLAAVALLDAQRPTPQSVADEGLHSSVRATEYQAIMNAIRGTTNRNEAAARLGISPRTLRYKLARLREPIGGGLVAMSEGAAS